MRNEFWALQVYIHHFSSPNTWKPSIGEDCRSMGVKRTEQDSFLPTDEAPRKDGEYSCGYLLSHIPTTSLHNFIPSILPFPQSSCSSL